MENNPFFYHYLSRSILVFWNFVEMLNCFEIEWGSGDLANVHCLETSSLHYISFWLCFGRNILPIFIIDKLLLSNSFYGEKICKKFWFRFWVLKDFTSHWYHLRRYFMFLLDSLNIFLISLKEPGYDWCVVLSHSF